MCIFNMDANVNKFRVNGERYKDHLYPSTVKCKDLCIYICTTV